jgi:predicted deacylase
MPYSIKISPPDLKPYRQGNSGVDYVHVLDSGRPGPTAMIQALTHGNEFCGAIALCDLFSRNHKPSSGKLILAFANVAAFEKFDFDDPDRSRYIDEDYNRVWADEVLLGPGDSAELRRARELRPFVDAADYLLDLHSMHDRCRPLMVCGTVEKGAAFARRIGVPAHLLIDTGHPAGLRMIERGGFADARSPRHAALIECGQHWEKSSVDVAIETVRRFLLVTQGKEAAPAAPQRIVRVTEAVVASSRDFRFAGEWRGLQVLPKAGTPVAMDRDKVWRTPYDDCVLVMPSLVHLKPGRTMVRLGRYDS